MSRSYYPTLVGFDLREHLQATLRGDLVSPGIGRPVIIRKITDTPCWCFNQQTGSGNPHCASCQGEGFQFKEIFVKEVYIARSFGSVLGSSTQISQQSALSGYGYTDPHKAVAYTEHTTYPDYDRYVKGENKVPDKLYELKVDEDGNLVHPPVRMAKWKIKSVIPHHGDMGRVEFIELGLDKENI